MSNRSWLLLSIGSLSIILVVVVGFATPWRVLPVAIHPLPAATDFSVADISRARAFHSALMPWGVGSWALGLILAGVVGFTSVGSKLFGLIPGPFFLRSFIGVMAIELAINLIELPTDASRERVLRSYGLSTQDWRGWLIDRVQHFVIGASLLALGLTLLVLAARIFGARWWIIGGAGAAVLVIAFSFLYPLVFEPIFNKFTTMAPSPLRDDLMKMAARDGVPVQNILIADASRRGTGLNAYVSGFGASRRIVLYDVLLTRASPEEIKLVVAHELGHAKANDVGRFTLIGALATAIGVLLLALMIKWDPLLKLAGVTPSSNPMSEPRSIGLVLALIAAMTLLMQPISSLISRNIEARADVHALQLTGDPRTFVLMQRTLSRSNLSDPNPSKIIFWIFANHPTAPQRIAIARAFAQLNHLVVPPALANR
jgi:STE24 endopeptidase